MIMQNISFKGTVGKDWDSVDPRLKAFFLGLADHTRQKYDKGIILTCLIRSVEYNLSIGGNPKSAHLPSEGRAGDIRSRTFTAEEAAEIVAWVKMVWGNFIHFIHHNSGNGEHFHANINHPFKRDGWRNGV